MVTLSQNGIMLIFRILPYCPIALFQITFCLKIVLPPPTTKSAYDIQLENTQMNVPDISELYEASWREYERRPVYDTPKKNKKASHEKGATIIRVCSDIKAFHFR